jgi:hypothetical protein
MKNIRISSDIIPLGEFKTGISTCLKKVQATGHPLIMGTSEKCHERRECKADGAQKPERTRST